MKEHTSLKGHRRLAAGLRDFSPEYRVYLGDMTDLRSLRADRRDGARQSSAW